MQQMASHHNQLEQTNSTDETDDVLLTNKPDTPIIPCIGISPEEGIIPILLNKVTGNNKYAYRQ